MTIYVGVKCKKDGTFIPLAVYNEDVDPAITFYAVPLTPITCLNSKCLHSQQYGSEDKVLAKIEEDA